MPIKNPFRNPFKKTFAEKRKALGITRSLPSESYTTKPTVSTSKHGQINSAQANPKIRKLNYTYESNKLKLSKSLEKITKYKPKNEIEARKRKEEISRLKTKLLALESEKKSELFLINKTRNSDRTKRQGQLIFKKLLKIVPKNKLALLATKLNNVHGVMTSSQIDVNLLVSNYRSFITSKKVTYKELNGIDAYKILTSTIGKIDMRKELIK